VLVDVGFYLLKGLVLLIGWAAACFLLAGVQNSDRWLAAGRRALLLSFAGTVACAAILVRAIFEGDYSVAYVAEVSEKALPSIFKFTAFWAGMDGSMLMWLLFLSGYSALAIATRPQSQRALVPWIGLTLALSMLFFAGMVAFMTNPLERLEVLQADGRGMNPSLQNYWMAIHPPTLYMGYVGLVVPFAFAVGALVTRRMDGDWIRTVRPWVIWPWLCLGVGMVFGGHWAYVELGWGGYWAWDPVENASFMPWLAATAYLHSVMVQERRGMFKAWNASLLMLAFALSIFGTFITRSGIVESVHSFARSGIGPWFLGFVIAIVATGAGLLFWRWPDLKTEHRIDALLSREFGFMLNNLVFLSICGVTLFLTMYPTISEWATGKRFTVGASAYTEINGTMAMLLLVLTGMGPVVSWRKASARSLRKSFLGPLILAGCVGLALFLAGIRQPLPLTTWALSAFVIACVLGEFHAGARVVAAHRAVSYLRGLSGLVGRNHRRYGGYVVHLAVAMFFIGVAGMAFRQDAEAVLAPGESVDVHGHHVTYVASSPYQTGRSDVERVDLRVERGGQEVALLRPEFKIHHKFPEPEKDVAVRQTAAGDLYAILAEPVDRATGRAKIQVLWNPLVTWVWIASYLLIAGTVLCLWPQASRRAEAT